MDEPKRTVTLVVKEEVTYHIEKVPVPEDYDDMDDQERDEWAGEVAVEILHPIDHFVSVDERWVEIQP